MRGFTIFRSQALAVAASQRVFALYALHPVPTFRDAIEERGSLKQKGLDFIREVSVNNTSH